MKHYHWSHPQPTKENTMNNTMNNELPSIDGETYEIRSVRYKRTDDVWDTVNEDGYWITPVNDAGHIKEGYQAMWHDHPGGQWSQEHLQSYAHSFTLESSEHVGYAHVWFMNAVQVFKIDRNGWTWIDEY